MGRPVVRKREGMAEMPQDPQPLGALALLESNPVAEADAAAFARELFAGLVSLRRAVIAADWDGVSTAATHSLGLGARIPRLRARAMWRLRESSTTRRRSSRPETSWSELWPAGKRASGQPRCEIGSRAARSSSQRSSRNCC